MNYPSISEKLTMFVDAAVQMADHHGLDLSTDEWKTYSTPTWAASVTRQAPAGTECGENTNTENGRFLITPALYDYAVDELNRYGAAAQEGSKMPAPGWLNNVVDSYSHYLDELEAQHPIAEFNKAVDEVIAEFELDKANLMSFEEWQSKRQFSHITTVPKSHEGEAGGSAITGYCVLYPSCRLLGYDLDTGEAWFEDYKEEFRGPIELIERKYYLWTLTECAHELEPKVGKQMKHSADGES